VIILRCCAIGWPGVGRVDGPVGVACVLAAAGGAAGVLGCAAGGTTVASAGCTGGVTTTAGGAAGFSTGGGATTAGAAGLTTGGVTTTLLSAAGAAGLAVTTVGFSAAAGATGACTLAAGGAAGFAATGAAGLAGGAGGCCCCCALSLSSLATSPGLEILERSIFGFTSVEEALSREAEPDLAEKCLRTFSASSSSIELEWVFFSVTPTSSSTSRIALLFTSSSLARSLIRIFIRSVFPPSFLLRDHNDLTILTL
jgi:hypothetical protein